MQKSIKRRGSPISHLSSIRTSVHPLAIKSTFHLKHSTYSSKSSPQEQKPINYFCVLSIHECNYWSFPD